MMIILGSTDRHQIVDGAKCRLWKGFTEQGVPLFAWVAAVSPQTNDESVAREFSSELNECKPQIAEIVDA